ATEQAALVAAGAALEVQPLAAVELAVPGLPATGAGEPLRPAPGPDELFTLLLRTVVLQEVQHRQPRLILDPVHCHDAPPVGCIHGRRPLAHDVSHLLWGLNQLADQESASRR